MGHDEYLRRNIVHSKSVGANANIDVVIVRLRSTSYAPKWLMDYLDGIKARIEPLPAELARWRDASPDKPRF